MLITIAPLSNGSLDSNQPYGGSAPNRAPVLLAQIPDQSVLIDTPYSEDMSTFFSDPDGDLLGYIADVLPAGLSISAGGVISGVTGGTPESVTTTVRATDPGFLFVEDTFEFNVITDIPVLYFDNHPNLLGARATGDWEAKFTQQPQKSCFDIAHLNIHQGLGMQVSGVRAATKAVLDAWRTRNTKGLLLWHENYRTFAADNPGIGNNQQWRQYQHVIQEQNWPAELFRRVDNGDVQPGRSLQSSTVVGGEWNAALQVLDYQQWVAKDWNNYISDDDAGSGVPGPNTLTNLQLVMMQDNWGEYNDSKYRSGDRFFTSERNIIAVTSQTRLTIAAIDLDLVPGGTPDGDGFLPVESDNRFYAWPSQQDESCGMSITGYLDIGGGNAEIKLASQPQGWSFQTGQKYFIANTDKQGATTEWDDPPSGINHGTDPEQRRVGMKAMLTGVYDEMETRFGYKTPLVSNGLGEDVFWWLGAQPGQRIRINYPTVHKNTHAARQAEQLSFLPSAIKITKSGGFGVSYHANSFTAYNRDNIIRESLWGRELIDVTTPSIPDTLWPPSARGVFSEIPLRKQVSDRQTAIEMLDELDASRLRFAWAVEMLMRHVIIQPKLDQSSRDPVVSEEFLLYPGDPTDPSFPHDRDLATIENALGQPTWDEVYIQDQPELVIWRTPDFGTWGFIAEYPDLIAGANFAIPSQKDPWIPSHLPGGQSLTPIEDFYTPPSAGVGMDWYRPDDSYVNLLTGLGPLVAPFNEVDAVLVKDRILNDGSKIMGDVPCGPLESFALIKAPS